MIIVLMSDSSLWTCTCIVGFLLEKTRKVIRNMVIDASLYLVMKSYNGLLFITFSSHRPELHQVSFFLSQHGPLPKVVPNQFSGVTTPYLNLRYAR